MDVDVSPFTGEAFEDGDILDIANHSCNSDDNIIAEQQCAVASENWEQKVKRLRSTYINEDFDMIIRFLKKVHPELMEEDKYAKYGNIGIELRLIDRELEKLDGAVKRKSMVIYDYEDETIRMVKNWYDKNVKNNAVCMYYSVSNFFPKQKTFTEEGKPYTKGRINAQNASFASAVVADFDHISIEENIEIDNKLKSLALPYDSIRTNENGWQKIFYLDEACYDKQIIPKFTNLLLSRGFKVDEDVNNQAQVARLLGSVNNKAFSGKFKDRLEQFKIVREKITYTRINVLELWDTLAQLPVVDEKINVVELNLDKPLTADEIKDKVTQDFNDKYGDILSSYWIKALPIAIKKMYLDDINEGYTNDFILFIVAHIKNTMKLSREDFIILMDRWADLTGYTERDKYIYIWDKYSHKDEKGIPFAHGKYTSKLAKKYGAIDFVDVKAEYKKVKDYSEKINVIESSDKIILNNKVTKDDMFKVITDGALKVFLCTKVQMVLTQKDYVVASEIIEHRLLDIKDRRTKSYLSELVKLGYLRLEYAFKGDGELKYYVSDKYNHLTATKNISFGIHETQRMLEVLNPNEIKLYILLKALSYNNELSSYSVKGLATLMDVSDRTITRLRRSLVDKGFLAVDNSDFSIPSKYIIFS